MTADRPPAVERASLLLGPRLGQGGQGTVHRVLNKRINEADGGGWDVVYKEYGADVLPSLDGRALAAMVGLLGELSGAEARWLCEKTAWPAALVEDRGRTTGFLMRAAPERFLFDFRSLSGTAPAAKRLANLEFLLNDDGYVAGVGLVVSDRDRLLLLADLAATLTRLHRIGIAVGDLSPKNLLFTTTGRPECFLIDSDAMRLRGASALPQAETPDWQLPAHEERATPAGDVFKLALLAVRLFARDQTATDPTSLSAMSPALGDLARSSLGPDPAGRPSPALWAEYLRAASATASDAPAGGTVPLSPHAWPVPVPAYTQPPVLATTRNTPPVVAGVAIAAVIVAVVLAIVFAHLGGGSHQAIEPPSPHPVPPVSSWHPSTYTPEPPPPYTPPPYTPPPAPTPTPTPVPKSLIETASVGSCFYDHGTDTSADLATATCTPGAFKVLRVFENTTDLRSCDDVTDSDESVTSARAQRVLCLSYLSSEGAFHAHKDDCVTGASTGGPWRVVPCASGSFKVLAVYQGNTDESQCKGWPNYNQWKKINDAPSASRKVLLCLSYVFPDDAAYATVGECLSMTGSAEDATFTNVGSCARSNVVVVGRSYKYSDAAYCQGYGWTTRQPTAYPSLAYTMCWRYL
ncbi:hypothetical protein [Kitasatospora sp. NPDC093558]|uniref:LppU/SCO3897 family protein n=1 Tax=Kitasatospora sp. NPDC093558 TaxID=3155201 RepID=UPI00344AED2C